MFRRSQQLKAMRILRYMRPYLTQEIGLVACMMIGLAVSLADPFVIKLLIDNAVTSKSIRLLQVLALLLIGLASFKGILHVVSARIANLVGQRIICDIRSQLFRHLETLDIGFYASRRSGEILSRVNGDVAVLQRLSTTAVTSLVTDCCTALGIAGLVFYLDWRLALLSLATLPLFVVITTSFGSKIRLQSKAVRERVADITSFLQEVIPGMRLVQAYAREEHEAQRLEEKGERVVSAGLRLAVLGSISTTLLGFVVALGPVIVLWYGTYAVFRGFMTLGSLFAFYVYLNRLYAPVYRLAHLNLDIQGALASVDRVFEILDTIPKIKDRPDAVELRDVKGSIVFQNVFYSYDGERHVLKDVSFDIRPGQIVAVVGRSGAGKSTIANLIYRFCEPQGGTVSIDGQDTRRATLASLRKSMAMVSQDPILFNMTIEENLRYAKRDATKGEIIGAAREAHIHDFIMSLPDGYGTIVGDRGAKLSGGQRQRIAIARAILKNPPILILDEATSSVDSESERLIRDAIERLTRGRTTLIIAHRFSSIVHADRILLIDDGEIVEHGTHNSLFEKSPLYRRMYELQSRIEPRRNGFSSSETSPVSRVPFSSDALSGLRS